MSLLKTYANEVAALRAKAAPSSEEIDGLVHRICGEPWNAWQTPDERAQAQSLVFELWRLKNGIPGA